MDISLSELRISIWYFFVKNEYHKNPSTENLMKPRLNGRPFIVVIHERYHYVRQALVFHPGDFEIMYPLYHYIESSQFSTVIVFYNKNNVNPPLIVTFCNINGLICEVTSLFNHLGQESNLSFFKKMLSCSCFSTTSCHFSTLHLKG